jgi:hypothetical protein
MKRLKLSKHLSVDELEQRYRQAVDPVAAVTSYSTT